MPKGSVKDRVQGIQSDIGDLHLHGHELNLKIGVGEIPDPSLARTMDGADTIEIPIYDPNGDLRKNILLRQKWDAELDGLHFRYVAIAKSGPELTLTLEQRWIKLLREKEGPKKAYRSKMTRAEFVKRLVKEACPGLKFYCPQLHRKQPIKTEAQAKKAAEESKEHRGKGVGDTTGLKVKGQDPTAEQTELLTMALHIADSRPCPYICKVAVIVALIDETDAGEVDRDNVLEGEGSGKGATIRDAAEEISGFLFGDPEWTGTTAVGYAKANPSATYYEIAQAVQASGSGEPTNGRANYGQFGDEARAWVDAYDGGEVGEGGSSSVKEPYVFEVKAKEDYWTAIKRLAKEVNWKVFVVGDVFFFIDEMELFRGEIRLALDEDSPGVEQINFTYDENQDVTEVEVECLARQWSPPPGSVVTVADMGPASIGFGDAPGGAKVGLSRAENAKTREGRGRYLVQSISVPLSDDPDKRLATIKLVKPTAPLPEPAAKSKSSSSSSSSSSGQYGEMGVLKGTPEDIVNEVIAYAHDKLGFDVSVQSVREANAVHGPTIEGNISDHEGPPNVRWAADISNGTSTPQEAKLAEAIADAFNIPWHGTLTTGELAEATHQGYRMQLIHNTNVGGDHYNHVHFGVAVA